MLYTGYDSRLWVILCDVFIVISSTGIRTKIFSYILKHFLWLNLAVNFHLNGEVIINVCVIICCFFIVYVCLSLFFIHLAN